MKSGFGVGGREGVGRMTLPEIQALLPKAKALSTLEPGAQTLLGGGLKLTSPQMQGLKSRRSPPLVASISV